MKIKKYMLPFFGLLFLIIVTTTIFIILVTGSHKKEQDVTVDSSQLVTQAPTQAVTPTVTPEPTAVPEKVTELYPAYQVVDNVKKYGYIDKTGAFVIDPTFDQASDFHEGVAEVTIDDKNCALDKGGNILFINDGSIGEFDNDLATFTSWDGNQSTLYGYLDITGKVVIEAKYLVATNFNKDGTAYVQTASGKYALIDKTGKELETYELDPKYDIPWSLQDGYLVYSVSEMKYGVINVKGEEILKPKYSEISYLGDGLFAVKKPNIKSSDLIMIAKQAIFNQTGEQLTDYSLYDLYHYYDGYCSATDDTSTFFVGTDGKAADNLPKFDGRGTLKLNGDVISAYIDGEQLYSTLDKNIFWQLPSFYALSDTITVKKLKLKPNRYVLVNYPEVEGLVDSAVQAQINTQLKSLFTDSRITLTKKDMLSVEDNFSAKLMKNLLIIERDGYDYNFGAAHGMPIKDFFFIDINTGTFYQLKDLFKAGSDYSTKINELITAEINADSTSSNSMYLPDSFTGIAENQYFRLESDALVIYFYPYDIAAYAAGFPEFTIPFDDIMDYIDTQGAFWNSFYEGN